MGPVVEIGCMRPLTSLMSIGKSIADNRRRQGRIRVHGIGTSLGKVLDVSAGGARLRAGRTVPPEGSAIELAIDTIDGPITLKARIAWVKRTGFLSSEIGVEFVEIDAVARRAITNIAMNSASEAADISKEAA